VLAASQFQRSPRRADGSKQLLEGALAAGSFLFFLGLCLLVVCIAVLAVLAGMIRNELAAQGINDALMDQVVQSANEADRQSVRALSELRARIEAEQILNRLGGCSNHLRLVVEAINALIERINNTRGISPGRGSTYAQEALLALVEALEAALTGLMTCVETQTEFGRELREVILGRKPLLQVVIRLLRGSYTLFR
jgi:hypothetical protein